MRAVNRHRSGYHTLYQGHKSKPYFDQLISVSFFVANLDVKFSSFNSTFQRHHADVEAKLASF